MAVFASPLATLMDAVALDFIETQRKLSYSMFRIWGSIVAGVGTAGVGFLIKGQATRTAFLWAVGALLMRTMFGAAGKASVPKRSIQKVRWTGSGSFVRNVPLVTFLVIVLFVAISSTAFWNFNGVYFNDIGGSASLFGLAIAIEAGSELPFYFLAAPLFRRLGLQRALLLTFVCATLRAFSYAFIGNPRIAIWIGLSNGLSWTLFWVAAVEHVNHVVKPKWRATGQALLNATCFGGGTILGILWNGFLLDYFRFHLINTCVPHAIQRVCFVSGSMLAILTVVVAVVFKIGRQGASPGACAATQVDTQAA
jgi:PPP family 3-phenylpropionic acid transporter